AIAEMLRPADGLRVAPDPRVARGPLEGKAAD
ncbi:MAG: hypothetical protein ACJAVS_002497, partial [Paracoccaceae bacterium]